MYNTFCLGGQICGHKTLCYKPFAVEKWTKLFHSKNDGYSNLGTTILKHGIIKLNVTFWPLSVSKSKNAFLLLGGYRWVEKQRNMVMRM